MEPLNLYKVKKRRTRRLVIFILIFISVTSFFLYTEYGKKVSAFVLKNQPVGFVTDSFNGVKVYSNGRNFAQSYGSHYAADGFYYGKKWQCVEFVKRYYYDYLHHKMPDGYGNAKDFWNADIKNGELNKVRNLLQFENNSTSKPEINDLVIFPFSKYGHVAIISKVENKSVEIIQQNIYGMPRELYDLSFINGKYSVSKGERKPIGWLRKK